MTSPATYVPSPEYSVAITLGSPTSTEVGTTPTLGQQLTPGATKGVTPEKPATVKTQEVGKTITLARVASDLVCMIPRFRCSNEMCGICGCLCLTVVMVYAIVLIGIKISSESDSSSSSGSL